MYCVFDSKEDIIGRFKMYNRAIAYILECENKGMKGIEIKEITKEEYYKYMENLIKNT